jgi:hypothetical protein
MVLSFWPLTLACDAPCAGLCPSRCPVLATCACFGPSHSSCPWVFVFAATFSRFVLVFGGLNRISAQAVVRIDVATPRHPHSFTANTRHSCSAAMPPLPCCKCKMERVPLFRHEDMATPCHPSLATTMTQTSNDPPRHRTAEHLCVRLRNASFGSRADDDRYCTRHHETHCHQSRFVSTFPLASPSSYSSCSHSSPARRDYPTIRFDARESVEMPSPLLLAVLQCAARACSFTSSIAPMYIHFAIHTVET